MGNSLRGWPSPAWAALLSPTRELQKPQPDGTCKLRGLSFTCAGPGGRRKTFPLK